MVFNIVTMDNGRVIEMLRIDDIILDMADEFKDVLRNNTDSFLAANYWALRLIEQTLKDHHMVLPEEYGRLREVGQMIVNRGIRCDE